MAAPAHSPSVLSSENFERGFLIDEEWMAGISKESDGFLAFVVDHREGGVIARQGFASLDDALAALNQIRRSWRFESTSGCSGERCGEGKCKGTGCKIYRVSGAPQAEAGGC